MGRALEGSKKIEQGFSVFSSHIFKDLAGAFSFSPMPENGLLEAAGAAIVQIAGGGQNCLRQADAPQRGGAPFSARGLEVSAAIC